MSYQPTNVAVGELTERQFGFLATRTMRPCDAQKRLDGGSVVVLGVGGIGAGVLQHLVGAGVRQFVLVDDDVVAASNFNRQFLYAASTIGSPKVIAAAQYVLSRVPRAQVRCVQEKVESRVQLEELISSETGIVVQAADRDSADLDLLVGEVCASHGVAMVTGAASEWGGYFGPLLCPGDSEALMRLATQAADARVARTQYPGLEVPWYSYGPFNSIVAASMAHLAIAYLAGLQLPKHFSSRVFLDAERMVASALWSRSLNGAV